MSTDTDSSPDWSPADELTQIRRARAYLTTVAETPHAKLAELVQTQGPVDAALTINRLACERASGARELGTMRAADAALAAIERLGGRLIIPEDEEWPAALSLPPLLDGWAPIALWARGTGRLHELVQRAVAVVGARAASPYGEHVAAEMACALAAAGVTVVAGGGGYGIDGAAHRGAATVDGGRAIAVQPALDRTHRLGETRLVDRVAERGGLVVSEAPPGTSVSKSRFVAGSRLTAALSCGTVVVEVGARSSSLETATAARAFGRVLMAVPGPVTSALSVGCHRLIRDRAAVLVTGAADVLAVTGLTP